MYKYGGPLLIGMGTVGCVLNLMVFTKKNLRKNPCSIYLIAYNVCSFLFIYIPVLIATLLNGYNMNLTTTNLVFLPFCLLCTARVRGIRFLLFNHRFN